MVLLIVNSMIVVISIVMKLKIVLNMLVIWLYCGFSVVKLSILSGLFVSWVCSSVWMWVCVVGRLVVCFSCMMMEVIFVFGLVL